MLKVNIVVISILLLILLSMCVRGSTSDVSVSDNCRSTVAGAAVNVDNWIYIDAVCTDEEQQTLMREFSRKGLSVSQIEKSRAAHGRP